MTYMTHAKPEAEREMVAMLELLGFEKSRIGIGIDAATRQVPERLSATKAGGVLLWEASALCREVKERPCAPAALLQLLDGLLERLHAARPVDDGRDGRPGLPVLRHLDREVLAVRGLPVEDDAVEVVRLAEVDAEPLVVARLARPTGGPVAVDREPGPQAAGLGARRRRQRALGEQGVRGGRGARRDDHRGRRDEDAGHRRGDPASARPGAADAVPGRR